jgi:hypothetical protein
MQPRLFALGAPDKADIEASDAVLVNAARPTWGTAMEVKHAHDHGKRVIAFGAVNPSPWLLYHATRVVATRDEALALIVDGAA